MKGEQMAKRSSFGTIVRRRLSDITNSQPKPKLNSQEECQKSISPSDKECIDKLMKERAILVKLIEDRNKLIELSGVEIQKLKACLQNLQLQNWNLAQSNSHLLADSNLGKEKIKMLQHQIACKDAVLKANKLAMEGKENIVGQKTLFQDGDDAVAKCATKDVDNRRQQAGRSQSMGPSTTTDKEIAENKRRCLKRQSARFTSQNMETNEDLFEIEDTKKVQVTSESRRSSTGRPSRRAAEKVHSYKEIPCNIKMRRME